MARPETKKTSAKKISPANSLKRNPTLTTKSSVVKKAPVKKSVPAKSKSAIVRPSDRASTVSVSNRQPSVKLKKAYVIAAIVIVILGALLYIFRGLFVAAVVNGQPISRLSVVKLSEQQSGKQVLSTLVRNALIEQEANKENVTVSNAQVNDQLKTVESNLAKQGESIDTVLAAQGMTMDDLTNLLRLDLLVQKMVGKQVKISNSDIDNYISKNQSTFPPGLSPSQERAYAKQALQQEQLNLKTQEWLQKLQAQANVIYFVQYP